MSTKKKAKKKVKDKKSTTVPPYPRHSLEKALRIPKGILQQNAGKKCTDKESAGYIGVSYNSGPYSVEIGSGLKYGLLSRPVSGHLELTEISRKILKPQDSKEKLSGFREALLKAPVLSDIYTHYRGENLPDSEFLDNALSDKFKIPESKLKEFKAVLYDSFRTAEVISEVDGKTRLKDISAESAGHEKVEESFKKLEKSTKIKTGETCFVMMPFADPLGSYYEKIYEPAITKAGLTAVRADNEIFGAGKIMDQVWSGIKTASVLIAELTKRNPNVFYELGLAHALKKPVVLVSSNEEDVPFDLKHIRVIYYDLSDPFWGNKLIDKVAENVLSAIKNPEEAIFKSDNE